jgi:hypothetical protein
MDRRSGAVLLGELIDAALRRSWPFFGWYDGRRTTPSRPFHHFEVDPSLVVRVLLVSIEYRTTSIIASYPCETILFGDDLSFLNALFAEENYERVATDLVLMEQRARVPWLHRAVFAPR